MRTRTAEPYVTPAAPKETLMKLYVPCVLARDFLHRGLAVFIVTVVVFVLIWLVFCECFSHENVGMCHSNWEAKIPLAFFLSPPLFSFSR